MLKEYLNDRKISIYSLSKKIGIPYSTLNDICNGKVDIDNCKISIIKKLSDYFNISLDKIYSICFNDDTKVYLKEYRVTGNIYTKNKSYYVSSKYNNEDINKTYQSFIDKGYDIKGFYFENVSVGKAKIDTIRKIDPNLAIIGQFEDNVNYSDMLLINAYGSKQSGVKTAYEDSIGVSKTMALAVGYENSKNQYTYDNFIAMVKLINSHIYADETDLCNITEAKQRYDEYLIALQEQLPDQVERINEINERLQLIEKEMTNIK